jgi:hypothetical protein
VAVGLGMAWIDMPAVVVAIAQQAG